MRKCKKMAIRRGNSSTSRTFKTKRAFGIEPFRWFIAGDHPGFWAINKPQRWTVTIWDILLLIQVRTNSCLKDNDKVEFVINGIILNIFTEYIY